MANAYTRETRKVTLELPVNFPVKSFGDETVWWATAETPKHVLEELITNGALRILNDGAGGKDKTDAERIAGMNKRIDSWMKGNFRIVERGDAQVTLMREAFRNRLEAAMGKLTDKAFAEAQADFVVKGGKAKPDVSKAIPLDAVIEGVAKVSGKTMEEVTASLEADARKIADERAKALATIDVSNVKLF